MGGSTGGKSTGGGAGATGGASSGAGGASGRAGAGGGGTSGGGTTCDQVRAATAAELESIQQCTAASECGQVLRGTSCGCTRDLVARNDADIGRFTELKDTVIDGQLCNEFASTCDCPNVIGFACQENQCTWEYPPVDEPPCTDAPIGRLCVLGTPIDSGDALLEGMPLTLEIRPFGCLSSSCTITVSASCSAEPDGDDFVASAGICLAEPTDPSTGCTGDCGAVGIATCSTKTLLTAGTHTVRYQDADVSLSVTFTVPSVVSDGSLCDGSLF
jgi:hypothetical protein